MSLPFLKGGPAYYTPEIPFIFFISTMYIYVPAAHLSYMAAYVPLSRRILLRLCKM